MPEIVTQSFGVIATEVMFVPIHVSVAHCPEIKGFGSAWKLETFGSGSEGLSTTAGVEVKKVWVFEPFPAFIRIDPCSLLTKADVEAAAGGPVGDPAARRRPVVRPRFHAPLATAPAELLASFDAPPALGRGPPALLRSR